MIAGFGQAGSTKAASGPGQHRYNDDPVFGKSMSYLAAVSISTRDPLRAADIRHHAYPAATREQHG
jgi:hypothetical protein